jgi:hypothetical protein
MRNFHQTGYTTALESIFPAGNRGRGGIQSVLDLPIRNPTGEQKTHSGLLNVRRRHNSRSRDLFEFLLFFLCENNALGIEGHITRDAPQC